MTPPSGYFRPALSVSALRDGLLPIVGIPAPRLGIEAGCVTGVAPSFRRPDSRTPGRLTESTSPALLLVRLIGTAGTA
jgi:hypothetical protein